MSAVELSPQEIGQLLAAELSCWARVYIATRLDAADRVRALRDALLERGVLLTYDWTTHGSVQSEGPARIAEVALAEASGVEDADMVVVLLPGGRGTHVELGIAIGAGVPVVLVGEQAGADGHICAFYRHRLVTTVRTDEGLVDRIVDALRDQGGEEE